jgi:hypothetical protein
MAEVCANKNSKEWKKLVSQTGDQLANLAFIANGYEIPDVRPATEIKKEISFKTRTENFAGIASKLRRYNQKHGTSHYFTFRPIWGNTFELTMKYNYLPVNIEKQRQRDAAKGDPLYAVNDFDAEGFSFMYPTSPTVERVQPAPRPIMESQQLDLFGDSDELIRGGESTIVSAEKRRKEKIDKEIIKQREAYKNAQTPQEAQSVVAKLEKLVEIQEEANKRTVLATNIESFEDIEKFGKAQLKEIKQLLKNPAISYDDVYYAQKILNLWLKAGDFSVQPNEHIFLDADEFNSSEDVTLPDGTIIPSVRSRFRALGNIAQDLQSDLVAVRDKYVTDFVRQYTDSGLTKEEIFENLKDVYKIGTMALNVSRHGDAMLQAIFLSVEQANIKAQQDANEVWEELDRLTPKFLKKSGGNFDILKQKTADGKETGRAVHRFSADFFDKRNQLLVDAFYKRSAKTGNLEKNPEGIKTYYEWLKNNTISFDPRILFEDSLDADSTMPANFLYKRVTFDEGAKAEHVRELKAQLGEKGYEYYLKRMEDKIEKFKIRREAKYDAIQLESNLSQEEKDVLFETWLKEYSPYWGVDMIENPAMRESGKNAEGKKTYFAPKGLREYVEQVPRKTVGGKDSGWYDKNFAKIEADPDLLAYHTFMMETLNSLRYTLPSHRQNLLGVGVLPTIQKSLMDIFSEKGVMMGIVPFWDKMKQLQTTTDLSQTVYSDVDPLTGDIEKNLQVQYLEDTNARVASMVREMKIAHKQKTGKAATQEEKAAFKREALDIISKEKSWDVTKILKAWSLTVMAHKHKSFIEPQLRLADQAFRSRKEIVTNKANQPQNKDGKVATEEGLDNLQSALDFFLDSTFYGTGGRRVEGVTKTKLYTKAEEERKKQLEELLKNEEDEENKQFIQNQIDSLGGFRTLSGTGDAVLKYMTLKGLGWNLFSAASNIGFGAVSNMIEASDGRNYSMKDFRKASMLVTNSIARNLSFNTLEGVNGNAVKIRTLMDKWDLLQTSNKEMYEMSADSSFSKLKRFGPFSLQERSEYLNYAPVMVAIMLSTNEDGSPKFPAIGPDGKTVTIWDAYDIKTGKLKDGYTSNVDEIKLVQKIKRVIEMNHGDYNNALQVKQTIAGRALSQFRTWMFEGFANRFESEKKDYALSYGLDEPYMRKGRYRSYSAGQLTTATTAIGTMFLPGIGTAIGAGVGYLGGKIFSMQENENVLSDTLFTLKQLVRKLMFKPTEFQDKFNALDAANMRKNMTELYLLLTLTGTALLLKGLAGDDEEDDLALNFLLNQTIRLQTDIGFYTNPLEFEKLTKTAVPMAGLIQDVATLFSDIKNFFGDDPEDKSIFESGPFKGNPKWLVHAGELLPGTAQGIRLYRTGTTVMD